MQDGAPRREQPLVGDLALARALWPLLIISFLGQLPPVATNLFVGAMAADVGSTVALIGGLRGLGGLTALATGILAAPLIDRLPRAWAVAGGLAVTAVATALASLGQLSTIVVFYLLVGCGGAILLPALQAAGGDGRPGASGVRAATLLSSVPSLAAVLAGPVLALPAEWWGWRGDFLAMAVVSVLLALLALARLSHAPPPDVARPGYLAAFGRVAAAPGATALLIGSTLRATLFVAGLTYLAPFYAERFGLSIAAIGVLFSACGGSFFLASLFGGRLASRGGAVTPERLVLVGLIVAGLSGPAQYLAASLPAAFLLTAANTAGHGALLAGIVGLLVGRWPRLRGALLGLNTAGMNLGIFAGAAVGGVGLAAGGYEGLAAVLGLLTVPAFGMMARALRR